MPRLLPQRKSNIKSTPVVKGPKKKSEVEFCWSKSAAQFGVLENNSSLTFHVIAVDSSQQKVLSSSSPTSTAQNSTSPSPCSPRLPNINNVNKKKRLSISTDANNSGQINPLTLNYSELHRAQIPSPTKKKSQTQCSIYPLIHDQRSGISSVNSNASLSSGSTSSSKNQQKLQNDKYIRLPTSQLRRLHVSNKYMKEAKTLYFNPNSKVFVPRPSFVKVS